MSDGLVMKKCPHCPAEYTTSVNLRAHQLGKHGLPGELTLTGASTAELLGELEARMKEWPDARLWAARGLLRGAIDALSKASGEVPEVAEALRRVGVPRR